MTRLGGSRRHVLIVEDEQPLLGALRDKFIKEGYRVSTAENGEDGLADAIARHPDMLIVDLIMPKMTGVQLVTALRKDPWGKDVPVIILTNLPADSGELVSGLAKTRPEYYLIKSDWSIGEIIEKAKALA